jgi:hypothetical protein
MTNRSTTFIGAHQWTLTERGGYDWVCVCGDHGRIASTSPWFVMESFGRHAHRKLEEAAVRLVLNPLPHTPQTITRLTRDAQEAREAGDMDRGNLLMSAANERHHEEQEALAVRFQGLEWYTWPDDIPDAPGVACDVEDFWLEVQTEDALNWTWEVWRVNHHDASRRGSWDVDIKLAHGTSLSQAEAKRAAWDALVTYQQEQEEEEPF